MKLAKKLNIDAIIAYASDPSAPTQAYVGNRLGLSSNPYESVLILTRKDLFRNFLKDNGFFVPFSKSFCEYEEAKRCFGEYKQPVIVKPIDSSGSKGITKIDDIKAGATNFASFDPMRQFVITDYMLSGGANTPPGAPAVTQQEMQAAQAAMALPNIVESAQDFRFYLRYRF